LARCRSCASRSRPRAVGKARRAVPEARAGESLARPRPTVPRICRPRHHPAGPVRRFPGRLAQCEFHHPVDGRGRQRRLAGPPGPVAQEAGHALAHEALLPAPDARLGLARTTHDLGGAAALCRGQDDPRSPHVLLAAVPIGRDRLQAGAVGGRDLDGDPLAHAASMPRRPRGGYLAIASDH
jgi:hypothetical protein